MTPTRSAKPYFYSVCNHGSAGMGLRRLQTRTSLCKVFRLSVRDCDRWQFNSVPLYFCSSCELCGSYLPLLSTQKAYVTCFLLVIDHVVSLSTVSHIYEHITAARLLTTRQEVEYKLHSDQMILKDVICELSLTPLLHGRMITNVVEMSSWKGKRSSETLL